MRRFLEYLFKKRKLSKRSVHDAWVTLSSLWTWAEKELGTPHIIHGKIERPRFPKPIIQPLGQEEIKDLVKSAGYTEYTRQGRNHGKSTRSKRPTGLRDRAIILVLLDCGIRAQELCDLTVVDFDPKCGRLHIKHGKGDKQRFVFLGNRSRKAMWKYMADREEYKPNDPLFATKTGEPIERNNLRHMLEIIAKRAGVTRANPHLFRHTFAVEFLRNGSNVFTLQQILGHADIKTVLVYIQLAEPILRKLGAITVLLITGEFKLVFVAVCKCLNHLHTAYYKPLMGPAAL